MGQNLSGTFDALRVTAHLCPDVVFSESLDASSDHLRHEPLPQAVPGIRTAVGLHIGFASPGGEQGQPVDFRAGSVTPRRCGQDSPDAIRRSDVTYQRLRVERSGPKIAVMVGSQTMSGPIE